MIEIKHRYTGEVIHRVESNNLRWANLSEANLAGVNLGGANLSGADLYGANLEGVNLGGANLSEANLYGANLEGANLKGTNLYGAYLGGTNLYGAKGIISQGPVGKKGRIIYATPHTDGIRVQAGCFWGTLPEFIEAVEAKYGKDGYRYGYGPAINYLIEWERENCSKGEEVQP